MEQNLDYLEHAAYKSGLLTTYDLLVMLEFSNYCRNSRCISDLRNAIRYLSKSPVFEGVKPEICPPEDNIDHYRTCMPNLPVSGPKRKKTINMPVSKMSPVCSNECCMAKNMLSNRVSNAKQNIVLAAALWDQYIAPQMRDALERLSIDESRSFSSTPIEAIQLTPREKESLVWLSVGKSNWEIAKILGITERTVKFHLKKIYAKLGVENRVQAISKAHKLKLISH